jgi:hypothetical protein
MANIFISLEDVNWLDTVFDFNPKLFSPMPFLITSVSSPLFKLNGTIGTLLINARLSTAGRKKHFELR